MLVQGEVQTEGIEAEDRLSQLVKCYGDDRCSLDLLTFLSSHPQTRFSRRAIGAAIEAQRLNLDRPLQHLISDGLVRMTVDNGVSLYSLTDDEALSQVAIKLVKFDWYNWNLMRRHPV